MIIKQLIVFFLNVVTRGEPFRVKHDKTLKIPPILGKAFRVKHEKS
jgi:hypothetical protein